MSSREKPNRPVLILMVRTLVGIIVFALWCNLQEYRLFAPVVQAQETSESQDPDDSEEAESEDEDTTEPDSAKSDEKAPQESDKEAEADSADGSETNDQTDSEPAEQQAESESEKQTDESSSEQQPESEQGAESEPKKQPAEKSAEKKPVKNNQQKKAKDGGEEISAEERSADQREEDAAAADEAAGAEVEVDDSDEEEEEPEDSRQSPENPPVIEEKPQTDEPLQPKRVIGATAIIMEKQSELLFKARVDSGAKSCSLHIEDYKIENESEKMADNIGKVIRFHIKNGNGESHWLESKIAGYVVVKTAAHRERRYKVPLTLRYKDFEKSVLVTLNNREKMEFPLLLGRNFLMNDFVVDVSMENDEQHRKPTLN